MIKLSLYLLRMATIMLNVFLISPEWGYYFFVYFSYINYIQNLIAEMTAEDNKTED